MAKIQWFWHMRSQDTEWNLGLVGPSVVVSLPALFKQIWQGSTLNIMAGQRNNYDMLENHFQSSAPVLFLLFLTLAVILFY